MITLYLYENTIQYIEKEEIKEYHMSKKAMSYGKIKNIPIFEENLNKLIKKEKWSNLFHAKKINIITPTHYEEIDKEVLTVVLNNNGIKEIEFIKEINLLDIKNNQIIINLHKTYLTLVKQEKGNIKNYFYPLNIFKNTEEALNYIIKKYSKKFRYIFLGSNENIPILLEKIMNNNIFYYNELRNYLILKYIP